jgi:hypothetical protein
MRIVPVRNCTIAALAEMENVPPGRDKTNNAKGPGNRERISFNGSAMESPTSFGTGAEVAGDVGGRGAGAGTGAGIRGSVMGGATGGGLAAPEKNLFKASNMDRAGSYSARIEYGASILNFNTFLV